jgi:hypothetical protein
LAGAKTPTGQTVSLKKVFLRKLDFFIFVSRSCCRRQKSRPDQPTTGYLWWYKCTLEWTFGDELTKLTPQSPPTAFSNQIHWNREKEKTKTKKMMGRNEN